MAASAGCGVPPAGLQAPRYRVGGTLHGLDGTVVLRHRGTTLFVAAANGPFLLDGAWPAGTPFRLEVAVQPVGQICEVVEGVGELGEADAVGARVICAEATYALGGWLRGPAGPLPAPVQVVEAGQQPLALSAPGPFTFARPLLAGSCFRVEAAGVGQRCQVTGGEGVIDGADVDTVAIDCMPLPFRLGGVLKGLLPGRQLVLNLGDTRTVLSANGPFLLAGAALFAAPPPLGVAEQPIGQACTLPPLPARMPAADLTDLAVDCRALAAAERADFVLAGSLAGARGPVVLAEIRSGQEAVLAGNGPFVLPPRLRDGAVWQLAVVAAPAGQACGFDAAGTAPAGTIAGDDVAGLQLGCEDLPVRLEGGLSGLGEGRSLGLELAGEILNLVQDGPFALAGTVPPGSLVEPRLLAQPAGRRCRILAPGPGPVPAAQGLRVEVACRPFADLADGQAATWVLGQPGPTDSLRRTAAADSLGQPRAVWGAPGGPLWVVDHLFRRLVGLGRPTTPAAGVAERWLGQAALDRVDRQVPAGQALAASALAGAADALWVTDLEGHRALGYLPPPEVGGAPSRPADRVLGQAGAGTWVARCTASGMAAPAGIAQALGWLAVADRDQHRVLIWRSPPAEDGQPADLVLGQPTAERCDPPPGPGPGRLQAPEAVALGAAGLAVADTGHQRVLIWQNLDALVSGAAAQVVLGQPDFLAAGARQDPRRALAAPVGLAWVGGQLWVADRALHRVVAFDAPGEVADPPASRVLGQPDPALLMGCNLGLGPVVGASSLCGPRGLWAEDATLWVADADNDRVLGFAP